MFKFNNNHIFTGYLKQLLASFNLPTCKIYSKQLRQYKEKYGVESPEVIQSILKDDGSNETLTRYIPYIKDGKLQEYIPLKSSNTRQNFVWKEINTYSRNKKIHNYTKNLKIKNNIYDTYTHEYLGDYLRFLRDYDGIDLMPLYNCFSNKLCTNILLECDHTDAAGHKIGHFIFNSSDLHYKIFMLPVKLFKDYTIAIDSNMPVEICCGIYGKYQDTDDLFTAIAHNTYVKYGQMRFNEPVLFSKLKELYSFIQQDTLTRLAQREDDLKLFIKLPVNNESSIVVLEGDYCFWNDKYVEAVDTEKNNKNYTNFNQYKNHYITNYEDLSTNKIISDYKYSMTRDFKPITQLQLLSVNTKESYPFSNYLVEYLCDNVITPIDEISDNVKRVQMAVYKNTDGAIAHLNELGLPDGLWDSRTRAIIYDALQKNVFEIEKTNNYLKSKDFVKVKPNKDIDTLGYINHVAEYEYKYPITNTEKESLANVDIYPDLYTDQKEK